MSKKSKEYAIECNGCGRRAVITRKPRKNEVPQDWGIISFSINGNTCMHPLCGICAVTLMGATHKLLEARGLRVLGVASTVLDMVDMVDDEKDPKTVN